MTGDPTASPTERYARRLAVMLSLAAALTAGGLTLLFSQLPPGARPWNLSVIGAVGLFSGARLGLMRGVGFTVLALVLKDAAVLAVFGWPPYLLGYLFFAGYVVLGWGVLRRSASPLRVGLTALGGGLGFFLVSNFFSWLGQALPYGYTLAGLIECYVAAIPFYRGTLLGDLLFGAILFGAHAVLVARHEARLAAVAVRAGR